MSAVGFEPTSPKTLRPERNPLDHSGKLTRYSSKTTRIYKQPQTHEHTPNAPIKYTQQRQRRTKIKQTKHATITPSHSQYNTIFSTMHNTTPHNEKQTTNYCDNTIVALSPIPCSPISIELIDGCHVLTNVRAYRMMGFRTLDHDVL